MPKSRYLTGLDAEQRAKLEQKLLTRQSGRCFICDQPVDLMLHKGQLDIDHIDPLIEDGLDAENNFAITHASCNRSKGAANLEIARRLAEFERLQEKAQDTGRRICLRQARAAKSRAVAAELRRMAKEYQKRAAELSSANLLAG